MVKSRAETAEVDSVQTAMALFVAANVALTVLLAVMVATRKWRRDCRERESAEHRARVRTALGGSDGDLHALLRRAVNRSALQADLARVLPSVAGGDDGYTARRARAVRTSGLGADLRRRLSSPSAAVRGRAAQLVGLLALPDGVTLIAPLLGDRDGDVRLVAAGALAQLGTAGAADALVDALSGDMAGERLIERLGAGWAVPSVLARLGSEPEGSGTRASLARALGLAGDQAGAPALVGLLASADEEERICAARSLGTCGTPACHPALLAALDDPAWEVRAQAATSLGTLGAVEAVPALESNLCHPAWWVRANAAGALAVLGDPGLEALERAATGPDAYAAERANEVLAVHRRYAHRVEPEGRAA